MQINLVDVVCFKMFFEMQLVSYFLVFTFYLCKIRLLLIYLIDNVQTIIIDTYNNSTQQPIVILKKKLPGLCSWVEKIQDNAFLLCFDKPSF